MERINSESNSFLSISLSTNDSQFIKNNQRKVKKIDKSSKNEKINQNKTSGPVKDSKQKFASESNNEMQSSDLSEPKNAKNKMIYQI